VERQPSNGWARLILRGRGLPYRGQQDFFDERTVHRSRNSAATPLRSPALYALSLQVHQDNAQELLGGTQPGTCLDGVA